MAWSPARSKWLVAVSLSLSLSGCALPLDKEHIEGRYVAHFDSRETLDLESDGRFSHRFIVGTSEVAESGNWWVKPDGFVNFDAFSMPGDVLGQKRKRFGVAFIANGALARYIVLHAQPPPSGYYFTRTN